MLRKLFWKILSAGLDGLVAFGLAAFVTLLKLCVLPGMSERFLHTKVHQNPLKNDMVIACYTFLLCHFI